MVWKGIDLGALKNVMQHKTLRGGGGEGKLQA